MQSRTIWRKPGRSQGSGNCVEVALTPQAVGVRDTKNRAAGHVTVDAARWSAFLAHVKAGTFDL
ncbi:DUF397 domain-containing protein [Haloactinomyces albus]|uniref:DUF397 domain-containing protein n=1 Tax=Haloactinomyces albus TaxID=1352928 RepID=A0AAE3ZDH4_9ACTN|nr:DUF397 domain-containing protein [Haloactinomyces albus]MDR7301786.1 hypothetical protein [Haloactinomyces albus]